MIRAQFSRQAGIESAAIAWFGHGAGFSHVDIVLPGGELLGARSDVCAGVPPGVQVRPQGYARWSRTLAVELGADDAMTARFYALATAEIGKPYDLRSIFGFVSGRDWRDPAHWFCSEYFIAMLEGCGWLPFPIATPASKVDPDDAVLIVSVRTQILMVP